MRNQFFLSFSKGFFYRRIKSIYAVVVQLPFDEEDLPHFLTLL